MSRVWTPAKLSATPSTTAGASRKTVKGPSLSSEKHSTHTWPRPPPPKRNIAVTQKWLDDITVRQMEREKFKNPMLTTTEISKKRDDPRPKPPVVPTPTGSGTQTPKTEAEQEAKKQEGGKLKEEASGPSEMDVD
ncbi:hypothetical protein DFJ43DRAFT_1154180 [Lentinula guzmanii]|uniref:Uncharacterized protein n=1 Tax=Lentinula guzmanii TaxID=2804957 RepID=A0AA38JCW5_9AGAR|nr:hypothetical protein DFJ43DRAFT_1154180 [Lentinula guzmanii]